MPANSGQGKVQYLRSELHIDSARIVLSDLIGFVQDPGKRRPMLVDFEGRTADGIIKMGGEINPFAWSADANSGGTQKVRWSPYVEGLTVYVENVDVSAFGDMVPDSLLKPISGKMTGEMVVELDDQALTTYKVKMNYKDAKFGLNEESSIYAKLKPKEIQQTKAALATYIKSGLINTGSKGSLGDDDFRLFPSIQTAMNNDAVASAPKIVRAAAAADQIRYEDKAQSPTIAKLNQVAATLAAVDNIAKTAESTAKSVSAVNRTVNSVTGTLNRLLKR